MRQHQTPLRGRYPVSPFPDGMLSFSHRQAVLTSNPAPCLPRDARAPRGRQDACAPRGNGMRANIDAVKKLTIVPYSTRTMVLLTTNQCIVILTHKKEILPNCKIPTWGSGKRITAQTYYRYSKDENTVYRHIAHRI
jgi:hypothetical protein